MRLPEKTVSQGLELQDTEEGQSFPDALALRLMNNNNSNNNNQTNKSCKNQFGVEECWSVAQW